MFVCRCYYLELFFLKICNGVESDLKAHEQSEKHLREITKIILLYISSLIYFIHMFSSDFSLPSEKHLPIRKSPMLSRTFLLIKLLTKIFQIYYRNLVKLQFAL